MTVHFYFGSEECYGETWVLSLLCLILLVAAFLAGFVRLRRLEITERQSKHHPLNTFVARYREQFYWWEFVLFIRRVCIALLSVSINSTASDVILAIVVAAFLYIHMECQPFVVHFANQMESILLIALIVVIVAHSVSPLAADPVFIQVIISALIVLPFCLFFYFVVRVIRKATDPVVVKEIEISNQGHTEREMASLLHGEYQLMQDVQPL